MARNAEGLGLRKVPHIIARQRQQRRVRQVEELRDNARRTPLGQPLPRHDRVCALRHSTCTARA
eukprot:2081891-Prymnesium_polylepis.1